MNNDAVVVPGIAEALEEAAAVRPDAGVLACKVMFESGLTVMYAGATFRAWLGYSGRVTGHGGPDHFDELRDTGRADGAAMAVSRAAIERAGLLDERLFAYVEDVDWSLRIRKAGFAVVFVPDAVVLHEGSASTGGGASTANLYYSTRNTIFVAEQASPLPRGLRGLRRGVVVATHLAQALSHPDRRAATEGGARGLARRPRRARRAAVSRAS